MLLSGGAHRLATASLTALMCLTTASSTADQCISLEERSRLLPDAYPDAVAAIEGNEVVLKSSGRLIINDGQEKSHAEKVKCTDIKDMLGQVYPVGRCD